MKTQLPTAITTVKEAQELLTALHNNGEAFHPEDDATDLVGDPFTKEEGEQLNKLMEDIYNLDGNNGNHGTPEFDPCHFLNDLNGMNYSQEKITVRTNKYGMIVVNDQCFKQTNLFSFNEDHSAAFLNSVKRSELAELLQRDDKNGCYTDELSIAETGSPATKEELKENFWSIWEGENGPKPSTVEPEANVKPKPDYLFIGTYPNAYAYCDMTKETNRDFHEIAHVYFRPLELKIHDNNQKYANAVAIATADYERLKLNIDKPIVISATGQTVQPYIAEPTTEKRSLMSFKG